jgi:hypothetical protein
MMNRAVVLTNAACSLTMVFAPRVVLSGTVNRKRIMTLVIPLARVAGEVQPPPTPR